MLGRIHSAFLFAVVVVICLRSADAASLALAARIPLPPPKTPLAGAAALEHWMRVVVFHY